MVRKQTVTVKDVAKAAGVSQAAVSMALRGSKEISAKRTKQIQTVAQKLNYYPQAAGQLLRSKRKNQIGIVVAAPDAGKLGASGFLAPLLSIAVMICQQDQIAYQLELHHYRSSDPLKLPHQIAANMVDGAIVVGDVGSDVYDALDQRTGFPWVSIGEPARYSVMMDIADAALKLFKQVAQFGHKRVAYCDGRHRYLEHRLVYETMERFSEQQGWTRYQKPNWIQSFEGHSPQAAGEVYHWAKAILKPKSRPTVVVCHGNNLARSVSYAAADLGLVVGKDLSITSWGSEADSCASWPVMAGVVYDHQAMVLNALQMLKQLMADPKSIKPQVQLIKSPFLEGDSLGPCPRT